MLFSHLSNSFLLCQGKLGGGAGQLGVMLFFILSGFLMAYLYLERGQTPQALRYFIKARVGRVIPLFLLVVLLSFWSSRQSADHLLYQIPDLPSLISHLAFLSGDSVLWTIGPEIQFYAFFTLLWAVYVREKRSLYPVAAALIGLIALLRFPVPEWEVWGLDIDLTLIRSLPYFLVGVALGRLYHSWRPPARLTSNLYLGLGLGIPLLFPEIFHSLTGRHHAMWGSIGVFLAVSLVFFAVVFWVPDGNWMLENPLGDYFGKISYAL